MSNQKQNYLNYIKGKEPLEHATIPMGDHDEIFDFIKTNVRRNMWVINFEDWKKFQVTKNTKSK